jgi:hypothetical protein
MKSEYAKTDLLTTSAVTSIVELGGASPSFKVGALNPIRFADLASVTFKKGRAEVAKVETIGADDPTIAFDGTKYIIEIYNPLDRNQSVHDDVPKKYVASISASVGTAADNRTAIWTILANKINSDTSNGVTAAIVGGDAGMTITDDGSYLSGRHNAQYGGKFATSIKLVKDNNGGGFVDATSRSITTEAVYALGVGADLITAGTRIGPFGHLALESTVQNDALNNAVSGQLYNFFGFQSVQPVNYSIGGSVAALQFIYQDVWVDNGEGSSTANLAGYSAFELKLERIVYNVLYKDSPSSIVGFFAGSIAPTMTKAIGGLPTGTAGDENVYHWADQNVSLMQSILGTQTILYSSTYNTGLRLEQDIVDNDGMEFHTSYGSNSPYLITVGSGSYSIRAKMSIGTVGSCDEIYVGFRSAVAVSAAVTGYDDIIALNVDNGDVEMITEDANSGTRAVTDSTVDVADGETVYLEVQLKDDGTTRFLINDVDYSSLIASPVTHTAGQTLIPFVRVLQDASASSDVDLASLIVVPDIINRVD